MSFTFHILIFGYLCILPLPSLPPCQFHQKFINFILAKINWMCPRDQSLVHSLSTFTLSGSWLRNHLLFVWDSDPPPELQIYTPSYWFSIFIWMFNRHLRVYMCKLKLPILQTCVNHLGCRWKAENFGVILENSSLCLPLFLLSKARAHTHTHEQTCLMYLSLYLKCQHMVGTQILNESIASESFFREQFVTLKILNVPLYPAIPPLRVYLTAIPAHVLV